MDRNNTSKRQENYYKEITFDYVIEYAILTMQYFVLLITNPIIMGSDFLASYISILDVVYCTITLHCADYMLTASLTCDIVYDQLLAKIVAPDTTQVSYNPRKKV